MEKKNSIEYQLEYYVGEYIFDHFLPTISTDIIKSRKVIQVSDEDAAENVKLEEIWENCSKPESGESDEWKAYRAHKVMLGKKYLPHILKCYVPKIKVNNINELKEGIINSLWNTDLCAYSLKPENIKIEKEEFN